LDVHKTTKYLKMDLSLFSNGQLTIIATSNGKEIALESMLLFLDPDYFARRFLYQAQEELGIDKYSDVQNIIFALTGDVDIENKVLRKTYLLNDISRTLSYDGFSFVEAFKGEFEKNQIHVLNDAFAIALGVRVTRQDLLTPCLVVALNDGVGVSFINQSHSIISAEWGGDYLREQKGTIHQLLGKPCLYNYLKSGAIGIKSEFTSNLVSAIRHLARRYAESNPRVKSVFLTGYNSRYINQDLLKDSIADYALVIQPDYSQFQSLAVKGCLSYPLYFQEYGVKVIRIQYFSARELIHDFESFDKCRQHYISVKPLANPENYYKIIRSDGSVEEIKIGQIAVESDLESYRFN